MNHVLNSNTCMPKKKDKECTNQSWGNCQGLGIGGKPCCYEEDSSYKSCQRDKVRETTGNRDAPDGFEISANAFGNLLYAMNAFRIWKSMNEYNKIISGQEKWKDLKQIGCYYDKKYAHCWLAY